MARFADLRFVPSRWSVNLLDGLREYASLLAGHCVLGPGEEHDSSHYVEGKYFTWQHSGCSLKLFWCDEEGAEDWLCVAIMCECDGARDVARRIRDGLAPFIRDHRIA